MYVSKTKSFESVKDTYVTWTIGSHLPIGMSLSHFQILDDLYSS